MLILLIILTGLMGGIYLAFSAYFLRFNTLACRFNCVVTGRLAGWCVRSNHFSGIDLHRWYVLSNGVRQCSHGQ